MLGHAAAPAAADAPTPAAGSAPAAAPTVAVLALQGAFIEHEKKLAKLGCRTIELRQRADLQQHFDALVLPGGESTVQAKLLRELGMFDDLQVRIAQGLPVLGTCAGLILLAEHVHSASDGRTLATSPSDTSADPNHSATPVNGFRTFPITVVRNGYGRQLGSFIAKANLAAHTPPKKSRWSLFARHVSRQLRQRCKPLLHWMANLWQCVSRTNLAARFIRNSPTMTQSIGCF